MNSFVIDVNILFNALISGKKIYKTLFINKRFFTPDFALIEIEKYENVILKNAKLKEDELKDFTLALFSKLTFVPKFVIPKKIIQNAYDICKEIDPKDTLYFALSNFLNIPLVTRDKKLKTYLNNKGISSIIYFDDFLTEFINKNQ